MSNDINDIMSSNFFSVTVNINKWSAQKTDHDASNELTQSKGAVTGAAKVVKSLMAGANAELKAVSSSFDAVRTYVYNHTLPYVTSGSVTKKGPRLLPVTKSMDFLRDFGALRKAADVALDEFCDVYDSRKTQALSNQGSMTEESEYPDVELVRDLFGVSMTVIPVPDKADFGRGLIPPQVAEALGDRLAKQQQNAMDIALADIRDRALKEVRRIAEQLGKVAREEDGTRVYDSLINNIRQIAELFDSSYFGDSEEVKDVISRIQDELCVHDASVYKDNPTLATKTVKSAEDIGKLIDDMDVFF